MVKYNIKSSRVNAKASLVAENLEKITSKMISKGKIESALASLEKAVHQYPNDADVSYLYASILKKNKRIKDASKVYSALLKEHPEHVPSLVDLAGLNAKNGKYKKNHHLLKCALEVAPERADIQAKYANSLQLLKNLPKSIEYYKKAIMLRLDQKIIASNSIEKEKVFNTIEAEKILWDTLALLARNGIHAFASHGTLLGLVREGGLLPHDKDIDIGIPYNEVDRATHHLQNNGWKKVLANFSLINPVCFLHVKSGLTLDLCGFSVEKETGTTIYGFWMSEIPKEWNRIIEIGEITLVKNKCPHGKMVWVVENPEVIFLPFYGNWKIPDKNFESVIGEPGLRGASLLTQCYGLSRIFSNISKGDNQRAVKQARIMQSYLPDDFIYHEVCSKLS